MTEHWQIDRLLSDNYVMADSNAARNKHSYDLKASLRLADYAQTMPAKFKFRYVFCIL